MLLEEEDEVGSLEEEESSFQEDTEPKVDDIPPEDVRLKTELEETKDQLLRLQAELQNVRRRAERDVENAHKFSLDKFVTALLPVVDNLERALGSIDLETETAEAVSEGLELTLKNFIDVLESFNIVQIDPMGQPFDADLHQAVTMLPNEDVEPNTVIDVFQKGYTLNGRLLRPAMVTVSKLL